MDRSFFASLILHVSCDVIDKGKGERMRRASIAVLALFLILSAEPLAAQAHAMPHGTGDRLGSVHFATSCASPTAPEFDHAIAELHSFEFGAAIRGFTRVLDADSTCAMARWGIALSLWGNPMSIGNRTVQSLETGRRAADAATRSASHASARERGYIAAVANLYADFEHTAQRTRVVAYERAMASVVAAQPADTEAKIFHAIALVAAAPPTDKTYANQLEAGALLEQLWAAQPDHPGLAHYLIHTYDVPALAGRARVAAERYAEIAPSAAHALHMPSHTFTRAGMWQESVNTNRRSIAAARAESGFGEALHASDYSEYAYLQMRNDSAARSIIATLPALTRNFDPNAITGAANGVAGYFALAAIPARYALERRNWADAEALVPLTTAYPFTDAMTYFAIALGASHNGHLAKSRAAVDSLAAIRDRLRAAGDAYWAEQVAIQHLGASAWLALAEQHDSAAVALMQEAAAHEDATEKSAVTPGPLAPAHELLGDMLLQLSRPAEALVQYRATQAKEPNRFRTLYGAMKAAAASGDASVSRQFAAQLERLTGTSAYSRH